MPEAARKEDRIEHTAAFAGLIAGVVVGALIGAAVVATGGAAAAAIAAAACTGASLGGSIGELVGSLATYDAGAITTGDPTVLIGGKLAARAVADTAACMSDSPAERIAQGSETVYIGQYPAARKGDKGECSFVISTGCKEVIIDGGKGTYLKINGEVPLWAQIGVMALGLIGPGALMRITGKMAWGAIAARLGGGLVGGFGGSMFGNWAGGKWFGEGSFGQKLTAFAFGWAGGWGGSKAGGAFGPPTHKFPPRTDASDEALGNVMTAMEKAKNPMGEPWSQNDNRVFSVATHEDGSVSYAVSGEKPSRVGQIYESMEQHLPENYKPASSDIDMSNFKAATVRGNEVKGTPCAEPKLLLGNENQSPITGMSTGWRGKGPNPYQQGNTGPFMNGCASCAKNAGIMQGLPTPPHYPVPPPSGIHDHYNNGPTHELGY